MSIYDVFNGGSRPFNKEEWAAQKQAQRQEAYEMIDNTCAEMMESGDSFRQYLDVQGRFDRYSVNNAILVSAQMPEATQLKERAAWKQSRVYVNKDAQKVVILEPGKEYTREDGTKAVGYNAKEVFDVSETSAKDRQQPQEAKTMRELVSAMIDASPVGFQPVEELEVPAFYDSSQQTMTSTAQARKRRFPSTSPRPCGKVTTSRTISAPTPLSLKKIISRWAIGTGV